jgi:hypothetical protein
MRARITLSVATIALGAVILSAPAFAQTYSNMGKDGHPISVNGLGAAANSMGGPGYQPQVSGPAPKTSYTYSNMGSNGHPISPNGLGAAANSPGGPGYQGN